MSTVSLHDIAPRLAQARDAYLADLAERERIRRRARQQLPQAEWLVAHRDLQLVRAFSTGNGRYIERRRFKLLKAEANLEKLRREAT